MLKPALIPTIADTSAKAVRKRGISSLQAARGIAAVLVVICHSSAFLGEIPGLWERTSIYLWFRGTALGVQMFFVISGMVIYLAHQRDFDHASRAGTFAWKRIRRIYPLYWILVTLTLWKHAGSPDASVVTQSRSAVIASNYLLIHLFSIQTIMVQAWTLFDEVQFYLIFALCILNRLTGAIVLSVWLAASCFFISGGSPYWAVFFSPYHLLFGLGMVIAVIYERRTTVPANLLFWLGVVVFCTALFVAGPFSRGVLIRLIAGCGAASFLLGAAVLERSGGLIAPRWLTFLGDASYSIYLVHFMTISAIARFAYAHWRHLPLPIGFWMLLLILAGILAGIAAHLMIEKPLMNVLTKRTGLFSERCEPSLQDT